MVVGLGVNAGLCSTCPSSSFSAREYQLLASPLASDSHFYIAWFIALLFTPTPLF
jgi:hypothetical protein